MKILFVSPKGESNAVITGALRSVAAEEKKEIDIRFSDYATLPSGSRYFDMVVIVGDVKDAALEVSIQRMQGWMKKVWIVVYCIADNPAVKAAAKKLGADSCVRGTIKNASDEDVHRRVFRPEIRAAAELAKAEAEKMAGALA